MSEKRMISDTGYEVKQSEWVGGKEFIIAENPNRDLKYAVLNFTQHGFLGEYDNVVFTDCYDSALKERAKRILAEKARIQAELDGRGLPAELFTAEHCIPHNHGQDLNGKVVAIKFECLAPEYRRGSEQLIYVTGGFGASPNSRGVAVFCVQLSDGSKTRFNRNNVLGIVKDLPDWAKERLEKVKSDIAKTKKERKNSR